MLVNADGAWEVEFRGFAEKRETEWKLVEFFVLVPQQGGLLVMALVLHEGRLETSNGKLRKTV